ncbi:hypothetical protein CPLU01_09044 [Colletotrichum plurivorum]|uniref:Uncharacterized protein n=1 Tax=Colletotrichum plurivorum TaxID=2175906 RepID=A0A8H6K9X7_9PEZI|nr:hypothetical protein CPLU01_09044 [Colletotrichum plurivorum]
MTALVSPPGAASTKVQEPLGWSSPKDIPVEEEVGKIQVSVQ